MRAAVNQGGLVTFDCEGTIELTNTLRISSDTELDGTGRTVTVSGRNTARVFHIDPGIRFTLRNVTIANGCSTNGAGIYNDGGIVTLVDCTLTSNRVVGLSGSNGSNGVAAPNTSQPGGDAGNGTPGTAGQGSAVFNVGTLLVTNTSFIGNIAEGGAGGAGGNGGRGGVFIDQFGRCLFETRGGRGGAGAPGGTASGGALFNKGVAILEMVSIRDNRALGGTGGAGGAAGGSGCGAALASFPGSPVLGSTGQGGGIFNEGLLQLSAVSLFGNTAQGGAGGNGSERPHNGATTPGATGGLSVGGAIANLGTNTMVNVTLALNRSVGGDGGVGGTERGCPVIGNGNGGDGFGAGLFNAGRFSATNCTIWANESVGGLATNLPAGCTHPTHGLTGAGFAASIQNTGGVVTLVNCIVGNMASSSNCLGVITDGGHSICSDASAAFFASGSLNSTDPRLGPLRDNGGGTLTLALAPDSPAIDAADGASCPRTDQRGTARPVGAACDIGSVEGSDGLHFPALRQAFLPDAIIGGSSATLRITLTNFNSNGLSNISFTNRLPSNVFISATQNLQSSCGGQIVATGSLISVSGVNLAPSQACTIAIGVYSTTAGFYTNFVGPVSAAETGPAPPSSPARLTVATPPTVSTGAATSRTGSSAILNAVVNPGGRPTTTFFRFGTTTNYGMQTQPRGIGSSRMPMTVSDMATGLAAGVGYHFQVVAENGLGKTFGEDLFFVTFGSGPGTAVALDGMNAFVLTPDLRNFFSNETVTIEVWFRTDAPGVIVDERGEPPPTVGWRNTQVEILASGEVRGRVWALPALTLGMAGFGRWHHVVLRYDKTATNLDGFVDGVEALGNVSGDRAAPWETGRGQYYGFGLGDPAHIGSGEFFRGQIGEVRIWSVARSADEVRTNLFRRLTGTEDGLVCYWRFDEGTGVLAGDASGHGNAGALVNGPSWATWPQPPIVRTLQASNVADNAALLLAEVNPGGTNTVAWFEWGMTTNYGQATPLQDVGGMDEIVNVSSLISGLRPSEYHFRVVASNSVMTAHGQDERFIIPKNSDEALHLNGLDNFVSTPDLASFFSNETVTIEVWFRPLGPGVLLSELGQPPWAQGWHASHMEIVDSREVKVRVLNLPPVSLGPVDFGAWHHAVLRYDRTTTILDGFLDGVEAATDVHGDRQAPWEEGFSMFYAFGRADGSNMGSGRFFEGGLDEIRIWNTARSNEQICANRRRRLTGREPGLICYWRFDEGTGPIALDSSGHGNHGNLMYLPNSGLERVPHTPQVADPLRITLLTGRRIGIDAIACPLSSNVLEASTNLINWTSLATNQATTDGVVAFIDPEPASHPWRFYRVRPE